MKIVTTKTEQIEIERDIDLPFYTKSGNQYCKVESDDTVNGCLKVVDFLSIGKSMSREHYSIAFIGDWVEISESEFESKFNEVLNKIINGK